MHLNNNNLPPISNKFWLWIKTNDGELLKVKRTSIIHDKLKWEWPVEDMRGNKFTAHVVGWAYP
jgi:hypothetical protein